MNATGFTFDLLGEGQAPTDISAGCGRSLPMVFADAAAGLL
jgi:hypothetical protein